jgi:hypothetical protein
MSKNHQVGQNDNPFHATTLNAASWLSSIVAMPRSIMEDGRRIVQIVGMPRLAQHALMEWLKNERDPSDLEGAVDPDGLLRSLSEPLYHEWVAQLLLPHNEETKV